MDPLIASLQELLRVAAMIAIAFGIGGIKFVVVTIDPSQPVPARVEMFDQRLVAVVLSPPGLGDP